MLGYTAKIYLICIILYLFSNKNINTNIFRSMYVYFIYKQNDIILIPAY